MDEDRVLPIRSWSFPPHFSAGIRPTRLVSGKENIRQSLTILFSTKPEERIYRPEYGFPLEEIAFEPRSLGSKTLIINNIKRVVAQFEPRIRLNGVTINEKEGEEEVWEIRLDYTLTGNGEDDSLSICI